MMSLTDKSSQAELILTPPDARFFTKQQVLDVIKSAERTQLTREEVNRIDGTKSSDQTEEDKKKIEEKGAFRMPPA